MWAVTNVSEKATGLTNRLIFNHTSPLVGHCPKFLTAVPKSTSATNMTLLSETDFFLLFPTSSCNSPPTVKLFLEENCLVLAPPGAKCGLTHIFLSVMHPSIVSFHHISWRDTTFTHIMVHFSSSTQHQSRDKRKGHNSSRGSFLGHAGMSAGVGKLSADSKFLSLRWCKTPLYLSAGERNCSAGKANPILLLM